MPHLSPMNWLLIIISIWAMINLITSTTFFTKPSKFLSPSYRSSSLKVCPWSW